MKQILLFAMVLASIQVNAQIKKKFINPSELIKPSGYTHIVTTEGKGKTIYISGQIPFNAKGELVGKGDFRAQIIQTYENIKTALHACGATFDDVVKMTTFIANYNPEYLKIVREIRSNYLSKEQPPANTVAGVTLSPDVLVEIEAIAIIK